MRTPYALLFAIIAAVPAIGQPDNDNCSTVVPDPLGVGSSVVWTNDNTGATTSGDAVPGSALADGAPKVWHAFTLTACADVTLSYCGTTPVFADTYGVLVQSCPADDPVTTATSSETTSCADGNWTHVFTGLPPGDYYIPVNSSSSVGAYQLTAAATACPGGPPNDDCPAATSLPINLPADCPGDAVEGDNGTATFAGMDPACLPGANFVDVWYAFNSDVYSSMLLQVTPGTAGFVGIEIQQGCGGAVVDCGYNPQTIYPISVTPFTDYVVRVFTDLDQGVSGTFGLCLSAVPLPDPCDGATVKTSTQVTTVTTFIDGWHDPVGFINTSLASAGYTYLLCDEADTLRYILEGDSIDADTLQPGEYHIHGMSHYGEVDTLAIGKPVAYATANGVCYDLSDNYVILYVTLFTGQGGTDQAGPLVFPDPGDGDLSIQFNDAPGWTTIELLGTDGRSHHRSTRWLGEGALLHLPLAGVLPPGMYLLRCSTGAGTGVTRVVVR